ncbi:MarR family winged helix-turn-helix transcriptional regulator [Actinophytocola sp.]|uniref:MarR family winged helix-turn-helix transcriptional regulator n=1 Tax=Actinophytocola sp. TaxID=1872138 RepID=UPI002ED8FD5A
MSPPPDGTLKRLETGLSALVRWNESKHIRHEVAARSGCELQSSELRLLEHFDLSEPMRISDIAECMRIDISTVSLQLRPLRRDGLVDATPCDRDRRVTLIGITAKGRATVAKVRAARRELLAEVFTDVPADDLEKAADVLLVVQEHMLAGMRELLGLTPTS